MELIDKPEYKEVTGLKELLMPYITEHQKKNTENLEKIKLELEDIDAKSAQIDNYQCPCVYDDWSEWGACSVTCAGGTMTRQRGEKRPATNGGQSCSSQGPSSDTDECETQACRKYRQLT